jgi:hypothetical protein
MEKYKKSEIKESNPEALYYAHVPRPLSFARNNNIDLFSPRGDHAKDAFDRELGDFIKFSDSDF